MRAYILEIWEDAESVVSRDVPSEPEQPVRRTVCFDVG